MEPKIEVQTVDALDPAWADETVADELPVFEIVLLFSNGGGAGNEK
jgi:hypothetical protein